jgi:oligopeptide/dipeptide ABC transporter ATP-binding protein
MNQDDLVLMEVKNLSKFYTLKSGKIFNNTPKYARAVNDISFNIYKGEILGVVGESGCGKSTLGRALILMDPPTDGQIVYKGQDITKLPANEFKKYKKEMQMIFQDPFASLNPRHRVGTALEEVFKIHTDLNHEERKDEVIRLLKEVGLKPEHYNSYPHQFSGGQRQRIGISRAIAINPELIVCDEAISALDVSIQAQVLNLLRKIQDKYDLTYLFITHDLAVSKHFCDRIMVMYLGHIMEMSSTKGLFAKPMHPYTISLLNSAPRPNVKREREQIVLEGEVPSLLNPPIGCPFNTRCPIAKELCFKHVPEYREISEGHFISCHFPVLNNENIFKGEK